MTEEILNGGAPEAPAADDLRSIVEAAVEKQQNTATPEPTEEGTEQTAPKSERSRDEQGRFATQEKPQEAKEPKPAAEVPKETNAVPETPQADQNAIRPPPGWSPKSKAAFDALPTEIKADIAKREQEVNQGFAKLAEYKGIERFAEQARQSGTTLEGALTNYTNWESSFRRDPFAAVAQIAGNLGMHPQQFAQTLLQRLGGSQQPDDPNQPQIHPALLQEIAQLKGAFANQERERAEQHRQAAAQNVDAFFADPKNKYADNVSEIMVGLINQAHASGKAVDLPSIYETACWMHPEVRQLLVNDQLVASQPASNAAKAAAAKAQAAAKAVTGAPARDMPVTAPNASKATSIRGTIEEAINAQLGV